MSAVIHTGLPVPRKVDEMDLDRLIADNDHLPPFEAASACTEIGAEPEDCEQVWDFGDLMLVYASLALGCVLLANTFKNFAEAML